eukprot:CAMPEP_0197419606 /NCGR_PEP_ID=MMETSP1170-20131217/5120_1 /TAXON_ID=54406 /ORGANISM="Sarcinochrysis sp, Strain CCMP770" /LENGTH=34 /DNA_ID= /DNA_START= /DNA_END= /DNA_ORIENTATION=
MAARDVEVEPRIAGTTSGMGYMRQHPPPALGALL